MLEIDIPNMIFREPINTGLHFQQGMETLDGLHRYMAGMLSRYPRNLKRHVQYILFLIECRPVNTEAVYAALLDLFIVLEEKGLPLRVRMLAMAKPCLHGSDYDFFRHHLESGITASTPVPKVQGSVLTRAYSGEAVFISKVGSAGRPQFSSYYDEAVSLLEYGDIPEAIELLEKALRIDPSDNRVAAELLAIYEHQNNAEAIENWRRWFIANNVLMPECWPLL